MLPASATTSTARSPAASDWSRRLGQLLDPLADRLYIVATLFGLAWRDIIPVVAGGRPGGREVLLAVVLLVIRAPRLDRRCRCTSSARRRRSTCSTPSRCCCSAQARRTFRRRGPAGRLGASRGGAPASTGSPASCTPSRPARSWSAPRSAEDGMDVTAHRDGAADTPGAPPGRVDDAAHLDDGAAARPRLRRGRSRARSGRPAAGHAAPHAVLVVAALADRPAASPVGASPCGRRRPARRGPRPSWSTRSRRRRADGDRAGRRSSRPLRAEIDARPGRRRSAERGRPGQRPRASSSLVTGAAPVTGPGLRLTLDDAPVGDGRAPTATRATTPSPTRAG